MLCPLFQKECEDERCAWWEKDAGLCSITILSNSLSYIAFADEWFPVIRKEE